MSKIFESCVLASDVDDTLIDSGYCAKDNIKWINRFVSDGGMFLLCTGRSTTALAPVKKALGFLPLSLVCNGGMLYDFPNNKMVFQNCLPDYDKYFFKKVLKEFSELGIEIHCGNNIYVLKETRQSIDHAVYEELEVKKVSFDDIKDEDWNKTVIFLNDPLKDTLPLEELAENYGFKGSSVFHTSCVINGEKRNYVEIHPTDSSKANGLARLKELYGIKDGNIFAIGDYYNDVSMLEYADISAVTKDSPDGVKALADYITVSCKDGAVADFIKYLYNLRKKGCK